MRSGLFLAALIGLAGASHISSAAINGPSDATWTATGKLDGSTSNYCAGGTMPMPEWAWETSGQAELRGNTLTYTTSSKAPNSSFTVDLALQPDGSGRFAGKDYKNRTFYVTLDPGTGARPFHVTYSYNACRRIYTPNS